MLGRMFGHEFHALLIFQKFLIQDDFAALFGSGSLTHVLKFVPRCDLYAQMCPDMDCSAAFSLKKTSLAMAVAAGIAGAVALAF